MAASKKLTIDQGTTYRIAFRKNTKSGVTLTPVSLAGKKARMYFKRTLTDETPMLKLVSDTGDPDYTTSGNLVIEAGADTGRVDVYIGATLTHLLTSSGVWNLELYTTADDVERLIGGTFELSRDATR